jgi:hypothetical protein
MIERKITMSDLLADHLASIGIDAAMYPGTALTASRDFYAGAAAMAQQFAANGVLTLPNPNAGDSQASRKSPREPV